MSRAKIIWRVIEEARGEINQSKARYALSLLSGVGDELDKDFPRTLAWAEWSLAMAEAFASMDDSVAESYFEEALERLGKLAESPTQDRLMRANIHFGDFLVRMNRSPEARPRFQEAKRIAIQSGNLEGSAKMVLKVLSIDLKAAGGVQFENFKQLKAAAKDSIYTYQEQYAVWNLHIGAFAGGQEILKAARKVKPVSKEYFHKLLKSVRGDKG